VIKEVTNKTEWDEFVANYGGHPLQLWGWGELKSLHNWQVHRVMVEQGSVIGGAQILTRPVPGVGKTIAYIPRGPVVIDNMDALLTELADYARTSLKAMVVTIEPHIEQSGQVKFPKGWRHSSNHILLSHTLLLDLTKTEEELLADIPRKRRYDIRKSTESIHTIREATTPEDIDKCLALYHHTAERAGFKLHGDQYYRDIAAELGSASRLIAVWNEAGEPIAMTWLAVTPAVAFELYGGINEEGASLRANFALKWHCITEMKREGVREYDFNGLLNDGISTFKRNFASHENELVGTWDYPLSPLYYLWEKALPLAKWTARTLGKIRGTS
jgi:lipid II:glycine glycyltransferase (peptidoglycan interpeptide bridge formation enzyme)